MAAAPDKAGNAALFLPSPVLLGRIRMAAAAFTRAMHLFQHSPQGINFLLVGSLLALGIFQGLQHLFHVLKRFPDVVDHLVHQFDGLMDCGRCRGDSFARGFWRARLLDALGTLVLPAAAAEIATLLAFRRTTLKALRALRALRFGLADGFRLQFVSHGRSFGLVSSLHFVLGFKIPLRSFRRRFLVVVCGVLLRAPGVQVWHIVAR